MQVKLLESGDEKLLHDCVPGVFDDPIDPYATREFLSDLRHHLSVALDSGTVVAFASAVHYFHPDKKRPEMWINEVGVAPPYRGRGLAKRLLNALFEAARDADCLEVWVLTERSNTPALRLYRSIGGTEAPEDQVMFTFDLTDAWPAASQTESGDADSG